MTGTRTGNIFGAFVIVGILTLIPALSPAGKGDEHSQEVIKHAKEGISHTKEAMHHLEESIKGTSDAHAKEALEHSKEPSSTQKNPSPMPKWGQSSHRRRRNRQESRWYLFNLSALFHHQDRCVRVVRAGDPPARTKRGAKVAASSFAPYFLRSSLSNDSRDLVELVALLLLLPMCWWTGMPLFGAP